MASASAASAWAVGLTRRVLSRPPAMSCWVWVKNSISRMPPRPSLTLCPSTRMSPTFLEMLIWRFIAWISAMVAKSRCLRQT
ncbi:hypothetical protein D3C86_2013900 [compost metagenome]